MNVLPRTLTLPPRTIAGPDAVLGLLAECAAYGVKGVLVHGRSLETSGSLRRIMERRPGGLDVLPWQFPGGEPTLRQLATLLATARQFGADWVAAVGGGSVMDVAKGCAGLLHADLPPVAYHDGAAIAPSHVPFVAVPTTAGTGSESTTVVVLTNDETGVKKSIRHPSFIASLVILDPGLLAACPPAVIASSGMDALVQAIESYVSRGATWFSDQAALKAMELIGLALVPAYRGERGEAARDLLQGSYLAGLALSNARLGLVHGLAHPLGARYHQPHGLVCAVCLAPVLEFNREVIPARYQAISDVLGADLPGRLKDMLEALEVQSPFKGRPLRDSAGIVRETLESGSTAANPRAVTAADVERILERIF